MQFTTSAFILSPLTFLWLEGLEASFPGETESQPANEKQPEKEKGKKEPVKKKQKNVTNTIAKVLIDQIVGGAWMTVLYIVTIGTLRGHDWESIQEEIQHVCSTLPVKVSSSTATDRLTSLCCTELLPPVDCRVPGVAAGVDSQLHGGSGRQTPAGWQFVWSHLGRLPELAFLDSILYSLLSPSIVYTHTECV